MTAFDVALLGLFAMGVFHGFAAVNRPVSLPWLPPEEDEDEDALDDEDALEDEDDEEDEAPPAPEDEEEEDTEEDEELVPPLELDPVPGFVPASGQCCHGYLGPPSGQCCFHSSSEATTPSSGTGVESSRPAQASGAIIALSGNAARRKALRMWVS
ncbi:Hypothetical protein A7982_07732 [Minicystis rosea]|nr:Hypothetical protein A7982_07732 [Minicystis rosea]